MTVRAVSLQNKLMVLFEKRAYSQKFFKQIYNYLMDHSKKLNTCNFVDLHGMNFGSVTTASYLIDENRELQMVRIIALMCCRLNYGMKDYMSVQKYSDISYDLVEATITYMKALLPYMYYQKTYDTLLTCLSVVLEFVDGDARSDYNTQKVIDYEFITIAASLLNLNYYNPPAGSEADTIESVRTVLKFNLCCLNNCADELSLHYNSNLLLDWLRNGFKQSITPEDFRVNEYALLPYDGTAGDQARCNFRISLLKMKVLECLLECVNSGDSVNKLTFLQIYTKLDPITLRKLFCFQDEMYRYYHKRKYGLSMLNLSDADPNVKTNSGFIIEIGVLAYALLVKIDEFHENSRQDRRYNKLLMSIMPPEDRTDVEFSDNTLILFSELFGDIVASLKRVCNFAPLNFQLAERRALNDIEVNETMRFYADITSQIDVLIDDKLITYTFILLPYCRLSSTRQKEDFLQKLDRSSPQAKCESLMEESKYLIREMEIDYFMKAYTLEAGRIILKYDALWRILFIALIVALNGIILASYSEKNGSRRDDPMLGDLSVKNTKAVMLALGILSFIFWVVICCPLMIKIMLMSIFEYDVEAERQDTFDLIKVRGKSAKGSANFFETLKGMIVKTFRLLTNMMFIYLLCLGASILLGIIYHPFFYCCLVSFIIVQSPQMNSLLRAIWEPKFAIGGTIILMFLIMYFFVMVSYNSFPSAYPDGNCYSLWTCFISSMDQTLKNGGLGNYLNSSYSVKEDAGIGLDYERLIFDNLEFLFITLLLIAIISGIIIDKFGEVRGKREENDADARCFCFICGRENKEIDRDLSCADFHTHVNLQHNLWDYVYFIAYLRYQEGHNPAGFSAIEKYVINKINKNDPSWFPAYKSVE